MKDMMLYMDDSTAKAQDCAEDMDVNRLTLTVHMGPYLEAENVDATIAKG